jgi:predicted RNA-binding protein with PUA-like domain
MTQIKMRRQKNANEGYIMPNYWLLKSEPEEFGWEDLVRAGDAIWDGVRNYQAANNMRAMAVGDQAFFYHSGPGAGKIGPHIVGICEVTSAAQPDPQDDRGKWVVVLVRAVEKLAKPVTLRAIKSDPELSEMALLRQSRLSVAPVTADEWRHICDVLK